MNPALLRDREEFKRRALSLPTVEKRKIPSNDGHKPSKKAKPSKPTSRFPSQNVAASAPSPFDYKSNKGSSQYRFRILAKIVDYMKQRHMAGDSHPLAITEILDETNQLDIPQQHKYWLSKEALLNNHKIEVVNGETFRFKPKFNIRDRKGLLRLLDKHDQRGHGGILQEDIEQSLPNSTKAFKALGDQIIYVTRNTDKKKVLFYNDKSNSFTVDEDLQKLWRSATVEGVDETKIEEYLEKQGITSLQDMVRKPLPMQKRRKGNKKRPGKFKTHNEHMANILQDYSEQKK